MLKTLQSHSRSQSAFTVLLITAFIYPFINLLRGLPYKILSFSTHAKEFIFFAASLYILVKLQYFIHRRFGVARIFNENIGRQIAAELVLSFLYTPVICVSSYLLLFARELKRGSDFRTAILFTIILFLIQLAYLFNQCFSDYLIQFRKSVMREEKLRYENMMVQYKALQDHLSPHFLFNCLSGLNTTIAESPAKASEIVYNMADCLRHVLTAPDQPTITLDAELQFINTYYKLLGIRYPRCIILVNRVDEADKKKQVPPCLLQLLVENAVKHNNISPEQPLTISFASLPPNKLEVSSNTTKKIDLDVSSRTGIGLENIKGRYSLLTGETISINQTQDRFTVILPLLEKVQI